jgi:tetratricopeptide (TPR) repeat protein
LGNKLELELRSKELRAPAGFALTGAVEHLLMISFTFRLALVFGANIAVTALGVVTTHSQNKSSEKSAMITGIVDDSENRPVGDATVSLESGDHGHKFTFQSDSDGRFRFEAVPAGSYELRASKSGYGVAKNGPFVLHKAESKTIELRLPAKETAATGDADSAAVKFSDEIHFNVAGVSDPSNLGGHGSDTVQRTKETLAKETASLNREAGRQPSNNSHPVAEMADAHVRLAEAAENEGRPLDAVREYQQAVKLQPSEANLFAWGADLLLHRAFEPAIEVFTKGHRLYPSSVRMLLGLSVATYDQGAMEQGKELLLEACDLNPADPAPYLFLGKLQEAEKIEPPGWAEKFARFVRLHPENALAHYYYAVALGKQEPGGGNAAMVESELKRAIEIDPQLGSAYVELGILYSQRKDYSEAISAFQKAIAITPLPAEAHYRLGQVYSHVAEAEKASKEIELFKQISEQKKNEAERERHKIQQFVYTLRSQNPPEPPSNSEPH